MTDRTSRPGATTAPPPIGHNKAPRTSVRLIAVDDLVVWPPAQEQADDVDEDVIDEEVLILVDGGQRAPVSARTGAAGKVEVVAAAHVLTAVRRHNEVNAERPLEVEVRVHEALDNEAAFRLLAQQIEPAHAASSLARGRFFARAVEQFGSEAAAATASRVSKAAVSKNLDVVRAATVLGDKVLIARDIGQRDAMWLMSSLGRANDGVDAPDAQIRVAVLDTLASLERAPAKKIFASLRAATRVKKPRRGERSLTHDGAEIARLRVKGGKPVRIDLVDADEIELDVLMGVIREALASSRRSLS